MEREREVFLPVAVTIKCPLNLRLSARESSSRWPTHKSTVRHAWREHFLLSCVLRLECFDDGRASEGKKSSSCCWSRICKDASSFSDDCCERKSPYPAKKKTNAWAAISSNVRKPLFAFDSSHSSSPIMSIKSCMKSLRRSPDVLR